MRPNLTLCILAALGLTIACGHPAGIVTTNTSSGGGSYRETNWDEPAVRIVFKAANFTDLNDFFTGKHTQYQCLGDATRVYKVAGADYSGSPTSFPASTAVSDDFTVSTHPAFLKAVSVDMTRTYYPLTQPGVVQTDNCSYRGIGGSAAPSSCADFDASPTPGSVPLPTVAPTATPSPAPPTPTVPTTAEYYQTGFYRVRDDWCTNQGPILSSDPETTKSYVGGATIDLDRTELGANEDLLMVVTYHALSVNYNDPANWPGVQTSNDQTVIKVNLIGTGLDLSSLLRGRQPRAWSFYQNHFYPTYWQEVASLEDPYGSLRSEQVYLPISKNLAIDRIRIDRVRGSFHLLQVDLYRLGNRGP